jgi:CheY-like chemotaxis protein
LVSKDNPFDFRLLGANARVYLLVKAENGSFFKSEPMSLTIMPKFNRLLIFDADHCVTFRNNSDARWDGGCMNVLIVESEIELAGLWQRHLERMGMIVARAAGQKDAIEHLSAEDTDIIIMDLVLKEGSALAVADYASYRQPRAQVIFVTNTSFFSDGSIFSHAQNACAFVQTATPPEDLAAMVEHYGAH